jgi:hypothetical protein
MILRPSRTQTVNDFPSSRSHVIASQLDSHLHSSRAPKLSQGSPTNPLAIVMTAAEATSENSDLLQRCALPTERACGSPSFASAPARTAARKRRASVSEKGALRPLQVSPKGRRYWHYRYRFEGRQKQLSLGRYPYVPVDSAWARRHAARHFLEAGVDPGSQKQALRRINADGV